MSLISVPIEQLVGVYPAMATTDLAPLIGGPMSDAIVDHNYETCCVRVSRSLNYSSLPVTGFGKMKNSWVPPVVRAKTGKDGKYYIYSTYDLRAYLTQKYYPPKKLPSDSAEADLGKECSGGGTSICGMAPNAPATRCSTLITRTGTDYGFGRLPPRPPLPWGGGK